MKNTIHMFQAYDCIITDRLHGMILAIVSNVPCIVFDNRTHKIKGVYESINALQYVKLITEEEINSVDKIISEVYESKLRDGSYEPPIEEFRKMADKICEIMDNVILER